MQYKDYYKIMGLARNASAEDIKRAHRKLARQYHPDVSKEKDAEARFKELSEAYEVLRDPEKRAAYDQLGTRWQAGQDFRPPPEWNAGAAHPGRGFEWGFERAGSDSGADFSDFFEALFKHGFATPGAAAAGAASPGGRGATRRGRSASSAGSRRAGFNADGEDLHAKILLDLEDAYLGRTKTITLQAAPGLGDVREVSFTVPKGVRPGQTIRLTGQGGPPVGKGQPGDLYLEVAFNPRAPGSANYRVELHDVYLDLPVAPWEAALGAQIQAPTPSGWVEVTVPPGSGSGRKLRLKGRGIPGSTAGSTPGDFYFVLQVVPPVASSAADKAAYAAMAEHFKRFTPRSGWQV
jgi:curved DNA-binding protein